MWWKWINCAKDEKTNEQFLKNQNYIINSKIKRKKWGKKHDFFLLGNKGLRTSHSQVPVSVKTDNSSIANKKVFEKKFQNMVKMFTEFLILRVNAENNSISKTNRKHRWCTKRLFMVNKLKVQTKLRKLPKSD